MRHAGSQVRDGGFQPLRPSRVPRAMALDCHDAANPSVGRARFEHTKTARPLAVISSPIASVKKRRRCRCHHFRQFWLAPALRAAFWGMGERSVLADGLPTSSTPYPTALSRRPIVAFLRGGGCHVAGQRFSAYMGGQLLTYTDRLQAPERARFRLLALPFAVCDRPRSEPPPGAA